MLARLSLFINDQLRKRLRNKALSEIDRYLTKIATMKTEITQLSDSLRLQRYPITVEHVQAIRSRYFHETKYLTGNDIFAVNSDIRAVLTQERDTIRGLTSYIKVEKRFRELQDSFLQLLLQLDQIRDETNAAIETNTSVARLFFDRLDELKCQYIGQSAVHELLDSYKDVYTFFRGGNGEQSDLVRSFLSSYETFGQHVPDWNRAFVTQEIKDAAPLLDDVDGKSLDHQQRVAVVTDEDNNLILAGAGSGKTLTISGKVKYLVERKRVKPKEILLLSFTRKAADEMSDRIANRLGIKVDVSTFHKLGLSIIAKAQSRKPVVNDEMFEFLELYMKRVVYGDKKQIQKLLEFFGFYVHIPKDISAFASLGDYHEHVRHVDFETLKEKVNKHQYAKSQAQVLQRELKTVGGESVKSLEEVMIANFLFLHGINYIYEHPYAHDTRDEQHSQYKPDFYLPDYDIYIEHFGVTKDMKVPWLSEFEEAKYVDGIVWKRSLHKLYGTILIESFSHYNHDGILLEKLEENLRVNNVEFREVDFEEIFSAVFDQTNDNYLREFVNLIRTFFRLFKSCGFTIETFNELKERNRREERNSFLRNRTQLFFELVEPIYLYYEDCLEERNEIDFNDMINLATACVRAGQVDLGYKYIIIDEYQDISNSRFLLAKAIKDRTGAKVMCVGDDWQSIYRFTGSDIELFTAFESFFGKHELLRIEQTYRNSQDLIDIAGQFVMQNPSQYRKQLKSHKTLDQPVRILGYQQNIIDAIEVAIREIVSLHGANAEILLLGRNNLDVTVLDKSPSFVHKEDRRVDKHVVKYRPFPNLNLYFLSAHRSKGLEADNVILLNAANSLTGFPNKISDDPVLSWVLTGFDQFPYAEDRRLFYVALTRTKNRTYILTPDSRMSTFVKELIDKQNIRHELIGNAMSIHHQVHCSSCKTGHLVIREGARGRFLGCTNYPTCTKTINDVSVLKEPIVCSSCGGYMVRRRGKFGSFYGCTNYPQCRNTIQTII